MRRIGRWMLNALTLRLRSGLALLSLLLFLATCVLWVRSYWRPDIWDLARGEGGFSVVTTSGTLCFDSPGYHHPGSGDGLHHGEFPLDPRPKELVEITMDWHAGDPGIRSARSFRYVAWLISDGGSTPASPDPTLGGLMTSGQFPAERAIFVRLWLVVLLFAILPATFVVRRVRRRTRLEGKCGACQYDLTGNVSGVCPECGKRIAEKVGAV